MAEYGLYLGRIEGGTPFTPNHRCAASEIPDNYAEAHEMPDPGSATYYVIESMERNPETGTVACRDSEWRGQIRCGPRVLVDPDAAGAGTGLSWADAFTTLSAALDAFLDPTYSACAAEVWIRGDLNEGEVSVYRAAHILGGFGGHEDRAWQRDPTTFPTHLTAAIYSSGIEGGTRPVVIEDLSMESDGRAVSLGPSYWGLHGELQNVTFSRYGTEAVFVSSWESPGQVIVRGCRFLGGPGFAIHAFTEAGAVDLSVSRSEFAGDGSASVYLDDWTWGSQGWIQASTVVVSHSRFQGGMTGILLHARNDAEHWGVPAQIEAKVRTNVFYDLAGDAIVLRATMGRGIPPNPGDRIISSIEAEVVGNTISDIGGGGVICSAVTTGYLDPTEDDTCTCHCRAWDNLITYTGGYAVSESMPHYGVINANVEMVGNDCYSNLACLLDDGLNPLTYPGDVNSLPGNADNWSERPVYRLRSARDYHLAETSPAIDRGHLGAPLPWTLDIDLECRPADGDGDGIARPDVGADELQRAGP